jgi:hypothetical protein
MRRSNIIPNAKTTSVARPTGPRNGLDQRFRWSAWVWSPPAESNRRPHPYHGTTGNRCANRRLPSSHPTVEAEVIGSLPTKLCTHSSRWFQSGGRKPGEFPPGAHAQLGVGVSEVGLHRALADVEPLPDRLSGQASTAKTTTSCSRSVSDPAPNMAAAARRPGFPSRCSSVKVCWRRQRAPHAANRPAACPSR